MDVEQEALNQVNSGKYLIDPVCFDSDHQKETLIQAGTSLNF